MALIRVVCFYCKKKFLRPRRRANEAIKHGWKHYCSPACQNAAKIKKTIFKCSNPNCGNLFTRRPKQILTSGNAYCSETCAATVNNSKFPKKIAKVKNCPTCKKEFTGPNKYCSKKCQPKRPVISKEEIINEIEEFYKVNQRIPFKREYTHWKAARNRFGTWNKAIEVAGLKPNPVMFAKKHTAKDGHICDSLSERIIDDWLSRRKIKHEINVYYLNTKYTADFKVGEYYIEFFGLHGELKRYDQLMRKKLKLAKENNLKVISIKPGDLFPKSKLERKLNFLEK